jgi:hypothetical protein
MQLYHSVLSGEIPQLGRAVPPELDAVRVALLQPDPKKRLQTADAAILMLKKWAGYSEMKVELGQICGLMTGIVRPRTGPRFTGDVERPSAAAPSATTRPSASDLRRPETGAAMARDDDAPSFRHRAASEPAGTALLGDAEMASMRDRVKSDPTMMLPESGEAAAPARATAPSGAYRPEFAGPDEATSTAAGRRAELAPTLATEGDSSQVGIERPEPTGFVVEPAPRRFGVVVAAAAALALVVGAGVGYGVLSSLRDGKDDVSPDLPPPAPVPARDRKDEVVDEVEPDGPILAPAAPSPAAPTEANEGDTVPDDAAPQADAPAVAAPRAEPTTAPGASPTAPSPDPAKPSATDKTKPKPAEPKPSKQQPGPPVTVHFRLDGIDAAYLMLGKRQIPITPRYDAKIDSGRQSVRWRRDPAEPWKSAGTFDLVSGAEFVIRVGAGGPTLKKM